MKQIVITKYGDKDVLKIQERKNPKPLPGEVLIVDRTFPFEQAGEAHAYIEARKNIGKVVLATGD